MSSFVFFLIVSIGVSSANFLNYCNEEKCFDLSPFEELQELNFLPDKEDLKKICPKLLKFLDCEFENIEECNGVGIEELALSPNESVAALSSLLLTIGSISADICNENTVLHHEYIANLDCFRTFFTESFGDECEESSQRITLGFSDFMKSSEEDEESTKFISCMETPLEIACVSNLLQTQCGQSARNTFVKVMRRIKPILDIECELEDIGSLKEAFFGYVILSDEEHEVYRSVLDELLKRRRR
ncbi:uncharacterized protein TNCT_692081 [Trichonephila clavata]|uniref:Uncharacterized protein n=1 Tax=Trichonephila clavata TaxID=2740835 RepID=A0A8X6FEM4_TRICU|nr:uncharacterized protein TNCT_692081 [Trichonephila clavata]